MSQLVGFKGQVLKRSFNWDCHYSECLHVLHVGATTSCLRCNPKLELRVGRGRGEAGVGWL